MLAIIGASGKLGRATLTHLLSSTNSFPINISSLLLLTSSDPSSQTFKTLESLSTAVTVRHASFDSPESLKLALDGAKSLFLISSPAISLDFDEAEYGEGREKHHFNAINAAVEVGVEHVYYTSLAFASPSKSRVMVAHIRTEGYLAKLVEEGKLKGYTSIREGLYSESWPLYLGHYKLPSDGGDERDEIVLAGDGKISWTSIPDLGFANAIILTDDVEKWRNKIVYLSSKRDVYDLSGVAEIVAKYQGNKEGIKVKKVGEEESVKFYKDNNDMDEKFLRWWVKTYVALEDGECEILDDTLERLFKEKGREVERFEDVVKRMLTK